MNKRYSHTTARRIIEDCSRLGMEQYLPVIVGYPGETSGDFFETITRMLENMKKSGIRFLMPSLIIVRPNSPLYDTFEKHGLANNLYYEWSMADGSNDLHMRIVRCFIARQVHANPSFTMEGIVYLNEIPNVSINSSPANEDLFNILYLMFERAGSLPHFNSILDLWNNNDPFVTPETRTDFFSRLFSRRFKRKRLLKEWQALEKDAAPFRDKVYRLILIALKALDTSALTSLS